MKAKVKKWIYVTFQKECIHKYPAAKDIPGVEFLQYPHRHILHFKVRISVTHNDRDLEFILVKRELESFYDSGTLDLDYKSMEMISDDLYKMMQQKEKYQGRDIIIDVSEDGENGAYMEYLQ